MEVWSGSITAGSLSLGAVCLVDPLSSGQCDISKARLSARAVVDPNRIPLFALTGPKLEVQTSNTASAQWISSQLLGNTRINNADEEASSLKQCPLGILVAIDQPPKNARAMTDILIYGVISPTYHDERRRNNRKYPPGLQIHAVLICSTLLNKAHSLPSPPLTPSDPHHPRDKEIYERAEFLGDPLAPSPKRRRVDTLFQAADEYHRKVRRKGLVAVSEYIEKSREISPMLQFPYLKAKRDQQKDESRLNTKTKPCSVASRETSLPTQISTTGCVRSASISCRNASFNPLDSTEDFRVQPSLEERTISANKTLLTRTILTCLRLYGYHRNMGLKKPGSVNCTSRSKPLGASTAEELQYDIETGEDDAFKTIYHATYRASTFALRKFLNVRDPLLMPTPVLNKSFGRMSEDISPIVPVLDRQKATDIVDSILKLFCELG